MISSLPPLINANFLQITHYISKMKSPKQKINGEFVNYNYHGGTSEGQSHCMNYWRNVHEFDVHDSEMDTILKIFLWKKNLTAPNPKIFYVYGGAILVFKGNFFQHLNLYICPPVIIICRQLNKENSQVSCFTVLLLNLIRIRNIVLFFYFIFLRSQ
jgi:hypothetical protein